MFETIIFIAMGIAVFLPFTVIFYGLSMYFISLIACAFGSIFAEELFEHGENSIKAGLNMIFGNGSFD